MLINVRHSTRYDYEAPVRHSVQRLYLTPGEHQGQRVVDWTIELPELARRLDYEDAFGNKVQLITLSGEHGSLEIVARGTVETTDMAGVVRMRRRAVPDDIFLRQTAATQPNAAIRALAEPLRQKPDLAGLHDLMQEIRRRMDYQVGGTHAETTAAEALGFGYGVCQDHAQVFLSAVREAGIPARYVSGYLAVEGEAVAEASHAWAEALVADLGWVGFDVANGICPTERYVRVAAGFDARSVAPVRGTRRGGDGERLQVEVRAGEGVDQ